MKRKGLKIFMITLSVLFCFLAMPTFFVQTAFAEEETVSVKYSLVPPNYNASPDETETKYNIKNKNLSPFTPFDFDAGKRMNGSSFDFDSDNNYCFQDQIVFADNQSIEYREDLALSMWIYFDATSLHNFSVVLELENGKTISWNLSANELFSLVAKSSIDTTPHAWNKIVLPFKKATFSENYTFESGTLSTIKQIKFSYYSALEDGDISSLLFYDVAVENAEETEKYSVTKQPYAFCKAYFFTDEQISNVCHGDSLTLPSEQNAILYAWQGKTDLKKSATEEGTNVKWRVYMLDPNGTTKQYSFGDTIEFSVAGNYTVFYRLSEVKDGSSKVILSSFCNVSANKLNAIFFDRKTLKTHKDVYNQISISTSAKFSSVSDISFEYDESAIEVSLDEDGKVLIRAKKVGEFKVKAKVRGVRPTSAEKEYETTLTVKSLKPSNSDDNLALKIFLWSCLGCFVLGFLISIVILLVKSRKVGVK